MVFKDRSYCASPQCINECGRQMRQDEKDLLASLAETGFAPPVSYAYFCGEPDETKEP